MDTELPRRVPGAYGFVIEPVEPPPFEVVARLTEAVRQWATSHRRPHRANQRSPRSRRRTGGYPERIARQGSCGRRR